MSEVSKASEQKVCFFVFDEETNEYVGKQIKKSDLEKFPTSPFTLIALGQMRGNYNKTLEGFVVKCTPQTLDNIAHFYTTGVWRNPHLSTDHRLELDDVEGGFYRIVGEYLNLPDTIEEPEAEEEEEEEVGEEDEESYDDDYPMGGLDDIESDDDLYDAGFPYDDREPGGIPGWEY